MQTNLIPPVGFGLWKLPKQECANLVYSAIECGYRHLDSASDYGNESEVGEGIQKALSDGLCAREDLWVTSKLWNTYHASKHVEPALDKTLNDLNLDYLDLYLIHFPIALEFVPFETRYPAEWIYDPESPSPAMRTAKIALSETWRAMEALVETGKVKRIGVCNYNSGLMQDLLNYARIKPAMLQIESHPYLSQEGLLRFCGMHNIPVTAFSPLGALSYLELEMAKASESVLEQSIVKTIAEEHHKTPAQVVLRWGVQRGTAVIPKTIREDRMAENLDIFNFELKQEEMQAISALNQNRRFNDPGVFCEAAFNTYHPIYD